MKLKPEIPFRDAISQRFDSKILYSLLAILTVIATVPLLLYGWKSIELNRDTLQTNLREFQLNLARSISNEVSLYVDSIQNQVALFARVMEIGGAASDFNSSFRDLRKGEGGLAKLISDGGNFYSVRVYDATGKWTEAGYSIEDRNINADLNDAFFVSIGGRPYTSQRPLFSMTLQEPVLIVAYPIYWKGAVTGVASAVASFDQIQRSLVEKSREGITAYLVDRGGIVFAHPDRSKLIAQYSIAETRIFKEMKSAHGVAAATIPFQETTPKGEVSYVATFDWVPRLNWGVVVQVEERRVFYSVDQMRRNTVQWGLIALAAALGGGVFFAKRLSMPIQQVAIGAKALANKDFSHKIVVRSRNEIGQLAETFNIMTEEIHTYIERLKDAAEENNQLFLGSIRMLAAAIDEKDPYTHGHSERVAHYSTAIAGHMGMNHEECEKVGITALLHDVGKIGIKDNVLRKPDVLTSEEFEMMKEHPKKGATIMSPVRQLKDIIPGIQHHHENYDGSGYPDHLKGEEIPIVARVIAVADVFDAMTTERPYQRAMDAEYALGKIAAGIGKRFDGRVVNALEKALKSRDIKLEPVPLTAIPRAM